MLFRSPGAGTATVYAFSLQTSAGLVVDHNRVNNPGMITGGSFTAFDLNDVDNTAVTFNDAHSSGTGLTNHYLFSAANGSTGVALKNNIFVSSMTASIDYMVIVDGASQAGFSADYNDYFSSNTLTLRWVPTNNSLAAWRTSTLQDANTISSHPFWTSTVAGSEDFHPGTRALNGRYNPLSGAFDRQDTVSSPTIDKADPALAFSNELALNGARANQGSYGNTDEASKTPRRLKVVQIR